MTLRLVTTGLFAAAFERSGVAVGAGLGSITITTITTPTRAGTT